MKRIKRYYSALSRYRKSSGFGIHSPFAFYFVTKVLRERLSFYYYDSIESTREYVISQTRRYGRHPRIISTKNARMLFRIVNYFKPQSILLIGTSYGVSSISMLGVSHRIKLTLCESKLSNYPATEKVLAPFIDRITITNSAGDAINEYCSSLSSSRPFILINSVENSDITDVKEYVHSLVKENEAVIIMRNISRHSAMTLLWNECKSSAEYGMTFSNEKFAVMVVNTKLPRQDFSLWF